MQNLFLLLIFLFFVPNNSYSQKFQNKTYTANQLKADLLVFKEALIAVHPALYKYQTPIEFEEQCEKVEKALKDGMTDLDFLKLVSTITKTIGCGHTGAYYGISRKEGKKLKKLPVEKRDTANYLPFNGSFRDHQLFVGTSFDTLLSSATEIFSIDGHSVTDLEQAVFDFPSISEDGKGKRLSTFLAKKGILMSVFTTFFPVKDSVELLIDTNEGKITQKFKTLKNYEILTPAEPSYDTTAWNLKFRMGKFKQKYLRTFASIFFYQHYNKDIAALRINGFNSGDKPMLDLIFDTLKAQKTKHLIIDLRGNLGGDIRSVNTLLSKTLSTEHTYTLSKKNIPAEIKRKRHKEFFLIPFLRTLLIRVSHKKMKIAGQSVLAKTIKPAKENRFQGKIYVLIDNGSFSGASVYSSILQNDKQALFIGEESGGVAQMTNGAIYFFPKPPNSKISIRIPRYQINHQIVGGKKGRGVLPDYKVKETVTSFINGEDKGLS